MTEFLFGWVYKTAMEDTIIDCVVCLIEWVLILHVSYEAAIWIERLFKKLGLCK